MGGCSRLRRAPTGIERPALSPLSSKKGAGHRFWGVRLTEDMVARLEAAFAKVPEEKTTVVAHLKDATGATRSNVRLWLRNGRQVGRLGRPTLFTVAEEATIAEAMELWMASGGLLTRVMMAEMSRDYVADMGAARRAQAPGKTWFAAFVRRRPELRPINAAGLDGAHARSATPKPVAKYSPP